MGVGRFFSRESHQGFFQTFSREGPKVVKFFSHSKLRKQPFFQKISNSREGKASLQTPM